jgi:hypothetical protein
VLNSLADEPFGCPELLGAVHSSAPSSEAAGLEFIPENGEGPSVRLRKQHPWHSTVSEGRIMQPHNVESPRPGPSSDPKRK